MANTIITPSIIAKVGLAQLQNNLVMGGKVYRQYSNEFVKVGDTISVRRPVLFSAQDGAIAINQDVTEGKFTVVMNKRKHVSWSFNTQDLTLSVEDYNERYIKPAAIALANQIDYDLCGLYANVWNWVGTPGQTVNSYADFVLGPKRLDVMAVPQDGRQSVLSPDDKWGLLGAQTSLYITGAANDAYREGDLGPIGGVSTSMDQNVRMHTTGALAGSPQVDGANQNVTYATSKDSNTFSLITKSWTNNTTILPGDVLTLAGCYSVNPKSKATTGVLQQFVVVSGGPASGAGAATLVLSPAMIISGPYQNVTAAPLDSANIVVVGSGSTAYAQNLVFKKQAFALVTADLQMPDGVAFKAREVQDGYSLRVIKWYDGENDEEKIRLDVLYGVKTIYADLATRLSGSP